MEVVKKVPIRRLLLLMGQRLPARGRPADRVGGHRNHALDGAGSGDPELEDRGRPAHRQTDNHLGKGLSKRSFVARTRNKGSMMSTPHRLVQA